MTTRLKPKKRSSRELDGLDLNADLNMTITKDFFKEQAIEGNLELIDLKEDLNMTYTGNLFNDLGLNKTMR